MIEVKKLVKQYGKGKNTVMALNGISFILQDVGFVFVIGKSGSGKTTLMNIMSCLDSPTSGDVVLNGESIIFSKKKSRKETLQDDIGIVFQDYILIDELTVRDNLAMALDNKDITNDEVSGRIEEVLEEVDIVALKEKRCGELSAGQKQRVAIARAIIKHPAIVFADEATGNLDEENAVRVLDILNRISKKCLVIMISHNNEFADRYADTILRLDNGDLITLKDNHDVKNLSEQHPLVKDEKGFLKPLRKFSFTEYISEKLGAEALPESGTKVSFSIVPQDTPVETNEYDYKKDKSRKLALRKIFKMVIFEIVKQRSLFVWGSILLGLFCMLGIIVNSFREYDRSQLIAEYLKERPVAAVEAPLDESNTVSKGSVLQALVNKHANEEAILRAYTDVEVSHESFNTGATLIYGKGVSNPGFFVTDGDWLVKEDEVVLSRNLAEMLHVKTGEYVLINGSVANEQCVVCGVVDIDESICFVTSDIMEVTTERPSSCAFRGVNVCLASDINAFSSSMTVVGKTSNIDGKKEVLLEGRFPQKDNEVLISRSLAENSYQWPQGNVILHQRLADLHNSKYGLAYSDILNLCDHTTKNVEIVGIYDDERFEEQQGDILFTDAVYEGILDDYFENLQYDKLILFIDDFTEDLIRALDKEEIRFVVGNSQYIYEADEITKTLASVLTWASFLCVVLISISVFVVISTMVRSAKRRIGIMRVLGYKTWDIMRVYLLSGFTVLTLAIVFSGFFYKLIEKVINTSFGNIVGDNQIVILKCGGNVVMIEALILLIAGTLSLIYSITKSTRIKAISLLR
ncbi:MAG: ABC transporter ATP-binding protein/permease [Lachnospiraceae bacterium]|nr:ABC transporter ATP-binding protein/permease [Lachnospiraceae bacterium]